MNLEFDIILSERVKKTLRDIPRQDQLKIKQAINKLSKYPPNVRLVKLKGAEGVLRMRIGKWRVLFEYEFSKNQVHILDIGHRREIYR